MNFLHHLRPPSPTVAAIVNDPAHPSHTHDEPFLNSESLARRSLLQHHEATRREADMLLLHTTGSLKIGEILRYKITYYPARERIFPLPTSLHLRIKNKEAIPLRAAYLHGPYVLYCSVKSETFSHWSPVVNPREEGGYPEFEPNLKAGSSWECELPIPETMRREVMAREREHRAKPGLHHKIGQRVNGYGREEDKVTWVVEVISQMLFSSTSRIAFDIAVARDERALNVYGTAFEQGTFSGAIEYSVMNTQQIWNSPPFPGEVSREKIMSDGGVREERKKNRGPKKVHLVLITHGIHSNCGADMLFVKESIDKSVRELRQARKRKKRGERAATEMDITEANGTKSGADDSNPDEDEDEDEEQVITRGYHGNVTRTERGIKYLGKRLARYAFLLAYPNRPLPASLRSHKSNGLWRTHTNNDPSEPSEDAKYKVTSISFIGHSLGGLVQTYAIAYIHAHDPNFFREIQPVNFVALATPFLGLSNENPIYVKFALDFGIVGRTGQDLGLTWRAPSVAASAMSGFSIMASSTSVKSEDSQAPGSKPLLRILPMGPAKEVLKMFRNRTVYANVVNDGVVPLRTSCLLFLDWKGLGRVEKARRANEGPMGQVSGLVGWGLGQLTSGTSSPRRSWHRRSSLDESTLTESTASGNQVGEAPLTKAPLQRRHSNNQEVLVKPDHPVAPSAFTSFWTLFKPHAGPRHERRVQKIMSRSQVVGCMSSGSGTDSGTTQPSTPNSATFQAVVTDQLVESPVLLSPAPSSSNLIDSITSSQSESTVTARGPSETSESTLLPNGIATAADGNPDAEHYERMMAPPRTTLLEAAGDILNPPLPPLRFLIDPEARPRTIFHDRVYHPTDIPPAPLARARTAGPGWMPRSASHGSEAADDTPGTTSHNTAGPTTHSANLSANPAGRHNASGAPSPTFPRSPTGSVRSLNNSCGPRSNKPDDKAARTIKPEEKIARAFHDGISWRKVLVRLEPDAHNNIIVRREFSNAYGWPVTKHLVETHFGDTVAARMRDDEEVGGERALDVDVVGTSPSDTLAGKPRAWKGGEQEVEDARVAGGLTPPPLDSDAASSSAGTTPVRIKNKERERDKRPMSPVWSDRGDCSSESDDEDSDHTREKKHRQQEDEERRRGEVIDSFLGRFSKKRASPEEMDIATASKTATEMTALNGSGRGVGGGAGVATQVGLAAADPTVRARESLEKARDTAGKE